jgi:hypothetical protein
MRTDKFRPEFPEKATRANARSAKRMYQHRFILERAAPIFSQFYDARISVTADRAA